MPPSKSLHETMQENCNDRLKPDPVPCPGTCVPFWVTTGVQRCLPNSMHELEESDGCGNTRWKRSTDPVTWVDTGETECDVPKNRIRSRQVNECGEYRWITTNILCCTPVWVNTEEENCQQGMVRVVQEDGCGNTRLKSTGEPTVWTSTGETRCEAGDVYEVEQISQCGTTRWYNVGTGCPCQPVWETTGTQRCTGSFIENQEVDGCGHTRWVATEDPVVWTDTGETRCIGPTLQIQQTSQCGTSRWFTTETPCTSSPEPNELDAQYVGEEMSGNGFQSLFVKLDAMTGLISWNKHDLPVESEPWVTGAFDRSHYEARLTWVADEPEDAVRSRAGSAAGVWFNLGDTVLLTNTFTVDSPSIYAEWNNVLLRIDIRKINESITGGATFGPFKIIAD